MKTLALRAPISVVVVWVLCLLTNPLWAADPIEGRWVKSSGDVIIELKVVDGMLIGHLPVSYTHLTLPTICSV